MSTQAGNLHFSRRRLTLEPGDTIVDTLLQVADQAYNTTGGPADPVDPPLGVSAAVPPADGVTPASRVMVIPEPPFANWTNITCGEPYRDTTTGRVSVVLTNVGGGGASCADVDFNLVFIDEALVDPPTFVVTEDVVGPGCSVTLTITWDVAGGVTLPTMAAAEAALEAQGYIVNWGSSQGGATTFGPGNFAAAPGNTFSATEPCSADIVWDMANLVGPNPFGVLVDPQVPEMPPNVLTGTVQTNDGTFVCEAVAVEVNVLFWAPHTKCGPVKCDTYNAPV